MINVYDSFKYFSNLLCELRYSVFYMYSTIAVMILQNLLISFNKCNAVQQMYIAV